MSNRSTSDSPLVNVASEIEERHYDLIGRQQHLKNKVTAMEHSIPVLMAYNMWMADDRDHHDTSCRMIREIIDKFSQSDPVDELIAELKDTINNLNQETAQLHDKIIDTDVKLEETMMELESLELANKEMEEKLIELRNEMRRHSTLSLHSIHSEDLICLRKIRQLAEKEFNMKNYIRKLKDKETIYKRQINQLLRCKESRVSERITKCIQKSEKNKELCCMVKIAKYNWNKIKKQYVSRDKKRNLCDYMHSPFSCCTSLKAPCAITNYKTRGGHRAPHKFYQSPNAISTLKTTSPYIMNSDCESLLSATSKTDVSRPFRQSMHSPISCDPGKTCNTCKISAACNQIGSCQCNCKEKCTYKLSSALYNWSVTSLASINKMIPQSLVLPRPGSEPEDSDEEFCECCTCGEESEDLS